MTNDQIVLELKAFNQGFAKHRQAVMGAWQDTTEARSDHSYPDGDATIEEAFRRSGQAALAMVDWLKERSWEWLGDSAELERELDTVHGVYGVLPFEEGRFVAIEEDFNCAADRFVVASLQSLLSQTGE